jgi:hypothetical protein
MPCDKYKELEIKERSAREPFAQFAYKQNQHLWDVSKTAAARIAKEEQENITALRNEMFNHRRGCSVCREDRSYS